MIEISEKTANYIIYVLKHTENYVFGVAGEVVKELEDKIKNNDKRIN